VVVSTYDERRWDDLRSCVESLGAQEMAPREVIVVVDHNPELLERARAEFSDVTVVPNQRPRGLAGARNAGIDAASGEIVAFIDDDARAEPDWLRELEACFSDADAVGAGGALIPRWQGSPARWIPAEFYWVFGCSYIGLPEELAPVRNPIGANMAARASALAEVDGFREGDGDREGDAPRELRERGVVRAAGNIPDDTDLAIRVKQRVPDAVWLYQPRARVLHTVTRERTTLGYFLRRCYEEGMGKANLARYVGSSEGLSSERRHLASALPRGFARGWGDLLRGDALGPLRSAAIVLGLMATAAGFAAGSLSTHLPGRR
jgi:glycosyltransferase involved in cell wall biosynthesis